jgi:hypothetical protein
VQPGSVRSERNEELSMFVGVHCASLPPTRSRGTRLLRVAVQGGAASSTNQAASRALPRDPLTARRAAKSAARHSVRGSGGRRELYESGCESRAPAGPAYCASCGKERRAPLRARFRVAPRALRIRLRVARLPQDPLTARRAAKSAARRSVRGSGWRRELYESGCESRGSRGTRLLRVARQRAPRDAPCAVQCGVAIAANQGANGRDGTSSRCR